MQLNWKILIIVLSEMTGTALLMALGCMGCITTDEYERSHTDIALAFGLVVMLCVHTFGPLSGGYINPWVSTAACILGHIEWDLMLVYYVAEFIGGLIGYGLLYFFIPSKYFNAGSGLCTAEPRGPITSTQIILGEFLATSVLIFVCAGCWDKRAAHFKEANSIRFGFLVLSLTCCEGYFTGTSMNIARSLPPVLFHNNWDNLWAYVIGQFLATIIISILWRFVFINPFEKKQNEEIK